MKYKTVIVFFPNNEPARQFVKYRNVTYLESLIAYCKRYDARYMNIYNGRTKEFEKRTYL